MRWMTVSRKTELVVAVFETESFGRMSADAHGHLLVEVPTGVQPIVGEHYVPFTTTFDTLVRNGTEEIREYAQWDAEDTLAHVRAFVESIDQSPELYAYLARIAMTQRR